MEVLFTIIIILLLLVTGFLALWVRNLIITQKKAAEVVIDLEVMLDAYQSDSLSQIGRGANMWMHDPAFKYLKEDTAIVQLNITTFRKKFFDAIELKND